MFGVTFKENCPDVRNTKVVDIIRELEEYGVQVTVVDPVADSEDLKHEYNICLSSIDDVEDMDAVVVAVPHEEFETIKLEDLRKMYRVQEGNYLNLVDEVAATQEESPVALNKQVLIDVRGMFSRKQAESSGFAYWRL